MLHRVASILGQVGRLCPKSTWLGRKQERYVGYAGIEFGSIPASCCVSTAFQRGMTRRDATQRPASYCEPGLCLSNRCCVQCIMVIDACTCSRNGMYVCTYMCTCVWFLVLLLVLTAWSCRNWKLKVYTCTSGLMITAGHG